MNDLFSKIMVKNSSEEKLIEEEVNKIDKSIQENPIIYTKEIFHSGIMKSYIIYIIFIQKINNYENFSFDSIISDSKKTLIVDLTNIRDKKTICLRF